MSALSYNLYLKSTECKICNEPLSDHADFRGCHPEIKNILPELEKLGYNSQEVLAALRSLKRETRIKCSSCKEFIESGDEYFIENHKGSFHKKCLYYSVAPKSVGPGTPEEQDRMRRCEKNHLHPYLMLGRVCQCGYEGTIL